MEKPFLNPDYIKLFDLLEQGIAIADENGTLFYTNKAFAHILGYDQQELANESIFSFTHKEDIDKSNGLLQKLKDQAVSEYQVEKRYMHKNGNTVWCLLKVSRLEKLLPGQSGMMAQVTEITKRKIAEENGDLLLKSYKDLFDASNDHVYILNREGIFLDVNKSATEFYKLSKDELIGKPVYNFEARGKNNQEHILELNKKAWHGSPQIFEWWSHVAGKDVPNEIVISRGSYLGEDVLIASVRDISERFYYEERLNRQRELLSIVTENSLDAVALLDEHQQLVYINPVIEKSTGYTAEEVKEIGILALIHPEDQKRVTDEIHRSIRHRIPRTRYKYRQRRKDGSYFWLEVHAHRTFDENGKLVRTVANLRDVDDEVKSKYRLLNSEARLREAQRLAQLGSWEFDMATGKLEYSDEFVRLFGFNGHTNQEDLLRHVAETDRETAITAWRNLTTEGKPFSIDLQINAAGKRKTLHAAGYAQTGPGGEIITLKGTVTDITSRKEHEETLRKATEEAERAARVKQQFLSNMSHELRTPLNAVLGMTNLLRDECNDDAQKKKLNVLKFSAERLHGIITDILDLSNFEEGALELKEGEFKLKDEVMLLYHTFDSLTEEQGLDLRLEYDERIPQTLVGDSDRIIQVLYNLVGNAVKFTDQGWVKLSIGLKEKNTATDTAVLHFAIEDTGKGIDPSEIGTIFDRFYKAEGKDKYKYGGTGLGLTITRRILEKLNTTIQVTSEVAKGTRFEFELALGCRKNGTNQLKEDAARYYPEKDKHVFPLSDLKILVAEDNAINQFVLKKIMSSWQLEPFMANNGMEALEMSEKQDFDIFLIDLQMPVMDGLEATRILREKGITAPIIAITAAVLPENKAEAADAGMDGFIAKPFQPAELKELLEKVADSKDGQAT